LFCDGIGGIFKVGTVHKSREIMKYFAVFIGIQNGVENWAVHTFFVGSGEGFFVETSPALMSEEAQAEHLLTIVKKAPNFSKFTPEIKPFNL